MYKVISDESGIIAEGLTLEQANKELEDYWKYNDHNPVEEAWVEEE